MHLQPRCGVGLSSDKCWSAQTLRWQKSTVCLHSAAAVQEEPVWDPPGTRLEPVWNLSGTRLEPVRNPSACAACLHARLEPVWKPGEVARSLWWDGCESAARQVCAGGGAAWNSCAAAAASRVSASTSGTCQEPVWNLSGTRQEPVWNPSGTCPNLSKTQQEPVWNRSGTRLEPEPVWRAICGGMGASQQPGKVWAGGAAAWNSKDNHMTECVCAVVSQSCFELALQQDTTLLCTRMPRGAN